MTKEPVAILVDIVRTYLGLTNEQIWQYNQRKILPNTPGLYVIIHYLGSKPFGVNSSLKVDEDGNYIETISTNTQDMFTIELVSQDGSAKARYPEVLAALKSNYSTQQQEIYNFRIAEVANNIKNISTLDGGSMLTRVAIDTALLSWNQYTKEIDYYDTFSDTVITNP